VNLNVGQYVTLDPVPDSGCTVFPAAGSAGAEYLVVPQLATGEPGKTSSFRLAGDTIRPIAAPPIDQEVAEPTPAEQFHAFLRHGDEQGWRGRPLAATSPTLRPFPAPAAGPPAYGDSRQFHVCSNLTCTAFQTVTATVRAVRTVQPQVAIFVDNAAPAGGLDSLQLDSLAKTFDTRLYPADTAAFGRESDIDGNTVVLVLMTPVVNKLVNKTDCANKGFVAGFFYGADLIPSIANSNAGELFYSIVPDPGGTLSCSHSTTEVERLVPITFIHEFQHMISFNHHVLENRGNGEVLWLNEGFSHYAEELGARTYVSGTPEFSRFAIGDLFNAYQYLDSTQKHFLLATEGIGSLAERGAAWLFVRFIVDRFSGGTSTAQWNTFTRGMLETSATGAENVANATGLPFDTVVTRWALVNWVSGLNAPGFTAPTALRYDSWDFRTTYASLYAQDVAHVNFKKPFPLTPTQSTGRSVSLSGTLRAGSGVYHRVVQPGDERGFTLHFTTSGGGLLNNALVPRLSVIRIQ
jgi:hypothetical protein